MAFPIPIEQILLRLETAGYPAYVVGGCVRDMLMGRAIHDWDIATAARPERVMELFEHTVPTGLAHGTVTVWMEGTSAEVTTFRRESGYADGRHPVSVEFVDALQEDLSRRDFTMNAMALDRHGNLTDLFDGRRDINAKCIRCVGDPVLRFEEDALRIFRALRFSAQLGFDIEANTLNAIQSCVRGCTRLSVERIRDELEKTLCSDAPQTVDQMVKLGMLSHLGLQNVADLSDRPGLTNAPEVRWTLFARSYGEAVMQKLRLSNRMLHISLAAASLLELQDRPSMRKVLAIAGEAAARCYAQITDRATELESVLADGTCWNLRMLAVSGSDFPQIKGPTLGKLLNRLLDHVLEHPQDNDREVLLSLAAVWMNGGM